MTWDEDDRLRSTTRQVVNTGMPQTSYYVYDYGGQRVRKITDAQGAAGKVRSGALEAQPNGHVLVSQTGSGRISEFDAKGEKVLDLKVEGAWMATRLPDGNLLVFFLVTLPPCRLV